MKRFYKLAAVSAVETGYSVTLDGRSIKTPEGTPLVLPNAALAEALADEWLAQGEKIIPRTMPLTQLASTALDRVMRKRPQVMEHVLNYAGTDLLCYRAVSPRDLVARQEQMWQPLLDWAATALEAALPVTEGLTPVTVSPQAMAALTRQVESYDDWALTALQSAVAALGSLVLGLALAEGRLLSEEAFAVSQLDENYQIEFWGDDEEAIKRREVLRNDVASAGRFLELCFQSASPMRS